MAKIISFFTAMFLFIQCLFGIGGLGLGKVVLQLEKDSYPVGTETIKATLYNCTFKPILVAPYFYSLERWEAGEWTHVAWKESVVIPEECYLLHSFKSGSNSFRLTDYDYLPAGRYRLTASGSAYAEFTLVGLTGEVTLTTELESYPVGTREITATLFNGSLARFDYTVGYRIDKFIDGEWVTIGPNLGFIALMVNLLPGGTETIECQLSCNEPMEAGRYRIGVGSACGEFTLV